MNQNEECSPPCQPFSYLFCILDVPCAVYQDLTFLTVNKKSKLKLNKNLSRLTFLSNKLLKSSLNTQTTLSGSWAQCWPCPQNIPAWGDGLKKGRVLTRAGAQ